MKKISLPIQVRKLEALSEKAVDTESRTARFSFSSDTPYLRSFGYETLSHSAGAMVTDRLDAKAVPFLLNHDWSKQIGKVTSYDTVGGKAYANVKMSRSAEAKDAMNDMADGVKTEISVGYIIHEMEEVKPTRTKDDGEDETPEFLVTKWEVLEVSLVSVPADYVVGVGRDGVQEAFDALVLSGVTDEDEEDQDNPDADESKEVDTQTEALEVPERTVADNHEVIIPRTDITMAENTTPEVKAASTAVEEANTETKIEVDVTSLREQEMTRIREISAIGAKTNTAKQAEDFIKDGKSVEAFAKYILDHDMEKQEPTVRQVDSTLGLKPTEQKRYNLNKAILESALGRGPEGFEAECSQEVARLTHRQPAGFFVPEFAFTQLEQRADLAAGTNNIGGYTIQTSVEPSLIPLLRNKMVVGKAGATMLGGLVGNLELPRQITAATATWNTENNDPTRTNQTFDQVSLSPSRLSAVTAFSKQLLQQSQLDVQMIVRDDLLKIIAIAQDLAALAGTGSSNQPTGILNTTADTTWPSAYAKTSPSVTFSSSGYPTWTNVVSFEGNVEQNNVDLDDPSCCYIVSPAVKALWKTLAKFDPRATNQFYPEFLMEESRVAGDGTAGTINGYRAFATQQLSSNKVIFGKFSDLIIATWGGLDLITDPYTLASTFQVRVIVNLLTSIALRYGPAFCYSTNTGMQNGS